MNVEPAKKKKFTNLMFDNTQLNYVVEENTLKEKKNFDMKQPPFEVNRKKSRLVLKSLPRAPIIVQSMTSLLKNENKPRKNEKPLKNFESDETFTVISKHNYPESTEVVKASLIEMERKMKMPSYLLPTASYKLKCVNKVLDKSSSNTFLKIPFVVGNSIKSHNIGAKLQETLSIIKGAPKRILEKNRHEEEEIHRILRESSPKSSIIGSPEPNEGAKRYFSAVCLRETPVAMGLKNLKYKKVLANLRSEYSALREKHTELLSQLSNNYDTNVDHQIRNLEEDMNSKEIEIDTFIKLFNEANDLRAKLRQKTLAGSRSKTLKNVRYDNGDHHALEQKTTLSTLKPVLTKQEIHSRGDDLSNTSYPPRKMREVGNSLEMSNMLNISSVVRKE